MSEINITIIGSGPSSLLYLYYLSIYYPHIKLNLITPKLELFRCTYTIFMSQVENTWILENIPKDKLFNSVLDISVNCDKKNHFIYKMDDFSIKLLDKVFEKNSLDDECKNLLEKIKLKIRDSPRQKSSKNLKEFLNNMESELNFCLNENIDDKKRKYLNDNFQKIIENKNIIEKNIKV